MWDSAELRGLIAYWRSEAEVRQTGRDYALLTSFQIFARCADELELVLNRLKEIDEQGGPDYEIEGKEW